MIDIAHKKANVQNNLSMFSRHALGIMTYYEVHSTKLVGGDAFRGRVKQSNCSSSLAL